MLRIQYIESLFLLALIPVLIGIFFFAINRKGLAATKIGDPDLVRQMTSSFSSTRFLIKFILSSVAIVLLILTLSNVRSQVGEEKVNRNGIDVMIALDVSKSMLAEDLKPSRLETAKHFVGRLVDKLGNDRVGIVIFAGKAFLQMPLTGDHAATKMYLSAAAPDAVPTQGTVITDALIACNTSFEARQKKYKAIILISDGEDHDKNANKTAAKLAAEGVVIHTVGIGSVTGTQLTDAATGELKKDKEGNIVTTKLNEVILRNIAARANGQYYFFRDADEVAEGLTEQLESMDKRTVRDDSLVNYYSYFQYFLIFALILLLTEFLLSERRSRVRRKLSTAFIFCLMAFSSSAQDADAIVKKGNQAYKKKNYGKAADDYNQAIKLNASNAAAHYNLGSAMFRSGKSDEAVIAYENATVRFDGNSNKSNAFYNKAVVYHSLKKIPECIDAYKAALKLDPRNEDARQNLQKVLKEQQKNQKQQPLPKQEQKKEKKKQEPKEQRSKLTKQQAENSLKALSQQERNLQDKLRKVSAVSSAQPDKDW